MAEHECEAPRCGESAVAYAMTGCIREHITASRVCVDHLDRAQRLAAVDNLWCAECGPDGQRTRARLRFDLLAARMTSHYPRNDETTESEGSR